MKLGKNKNFPQMLIFFSIFMIAEIHKIDLEAICFKILKIPLVKFQIFGQKSLCLKKSFLRDNRFYGGQSLNLVT